MTDRMVHHEVATYDGRTNILDWLYSLERARDFARWDNEKLRKLVLMRLTGEAAEFVQHLELEGKAKDWEDLKQALTKRFKTQERVQHQQYLLNTGTQGGKSVQEWAQEVRKLSLAALADHSTEGASEGENMVGSEEATASHLSPPPGAEAHRGRVTTLPRDLLDFIRKTNFIRGLREALRDAVWRRKCKSFDEAVEAAIEEEEFESSRKSYPSNDVLVSSIAQGPDIKLLDTIVTVLEARERQKQRGKGDNTDQPQYQPPLPLPPWGRNEQEKEISETDPRTVSIEHMKQVRIDDVIHNRCFRCHQAGQQLRHCRRPNDNRPFWQTTSQPFWQPTNQLYQARLDHQSGNGKSRRQ